jgi:hypothetical protein
MATTNQQTAGQNYFCCGNPWDDIFGSTNQPEAQVEVNTPKSQPQDFNNPFAQTYSPYGHNTNPNTPSVSSNSYGDEVRYSDEHHTAGRSVVSHDTRSVASRRSTDTRSTASHRSGQSAGSRSSAFHGKSLQDIEREQKSKARALRLQEAMIDEDRDTLVGASVLTSEKTQWKLEAKQKLANPEIHSKTSAVNAKVQEIKELKRHQLSVEKTETSRPKKELTPEDVRDPETVPGMKCKMDVDKEEDAKKKALGMINSGKYKYDERAGNAMWSQTTTGKVVTRKGQAKVQEIV